MIFFSQIIQKKIFLGGGWGLGRDGAKWGGGGRWEEG